MKNIALLLVGVLQVSGVLAMDADDPIAKSLASSVLVIAHRGASGYLPEHTLAAKALAHGMGADFLEQDVVLTGDDVPIVLHDIHVDTVTDVARVFPGRARDDGRYYAIDFTLDEIKTLRVSERFRPETGKAVYPARYPVGPTALTIPTLAEELSFIQGLNRTTGRTAGAYPEIKRPAFHRAAGKDISRIVLETLRTYGYQDADDPIFVQCFDAAETRRLREDLGCRMRIVQLIGQNHWGESDTDFDALCTPEGLRTIAEYADGIGPDLSRVVPPGEDGMPVVTDLVAHAHAAGLVVHPYTFRRDDLPKYAGSFEELLEIHIDRANVDGVFTDFPDLAIRWRQSRP